MNPHLTNSDLPDLLPVRMLNEFAYCPRLCYLEWVQGEFTDSADTIDGRYQHRRVDVAKGAVPDSKADNEHKIHARAVLLSSFQQRLIARIDLLEIEGNQAQPVEYKRGRVPDIPGGVWESDQVQLCAQGIILRENGFTCDAGVIYYVESKSKVTVPFDDILTDRTLELQRQMMDMAVSTSIPEPLADNPKCSRCSLAGICLPDEINVLNTKKPKEETRRLVPARHNALPVYVQAQGAKVGKQGDELVVKQSGQVIEKVRLIDASQLCVFGNVQISTQAIRELCYREIPVCYFTYGGWFTGYTAGLEHKNVELRIRQYEVAADAKRSINLARAFIEGKIRNARTMLRRNHPDPPAEALKELTRLTVQVAKTEQPETLLGLEGAAAKTYFSCFAQLLKPKLKEGITAFDFKNRNRRPPTDPVNALLSFVYAILTKDLMVTLQTTGFDPYLGFYHRPRYGRPALALDLIEEFRHIIGDSVVITMINNGEVHPEDFIRRAGSVAMTDRCRKQLLAAYERRMDQLIIHPVFKYTISYRRVLEVQARLLGRYLAGEIEKYPAFITR